MLWQPRDTTDIIYTQHADPDLHRYYDSYTLLNQIHWQPAMIIPTCCLIDQKLDTNLYLASDFNVSGLEDSFISGLYAENQIIKVQDNQDMNIINTTTHHSSRSILDPICNMQVHSKENLICGKSCQWQFKNNPEKYSS